MAQGELLHASAFAYAGAGCLLLGDSGTGKSRIVAEALVHGASLIADDQVALRAVNGVLMAQPPASLEGVLELRGMGLITLQFAASHPIHLIVRLGAEEAERLPEPRTEMLMGVSVPSLGVCSGPAFSAPSLLLYLKAVQEKRTLATDWRPKV